MSCSLAEDDAEYFSRGGLVGCVASWYEVCLRLWMEEIFLCKSKEIKLIARINLLYDIELERMGVGMLRRQWK